MADHAIDHEEEHEYHPPYMAVFWMLSGLTVVELFIPMIFGNGAARWLGAVLLIGIALVKLMLIARYFMHLKFDARLLGAIAAVPVSLASVMAFALLWEF